MKLLILILPIFLLWSCGSSCNCKVDDSIVNENDSLLFVYLTDSVLYNREKRMMINYNEPILYEEPEESYRLYMCFTFYDYLKIYRIKKNKEGATLYLKEYAVPTGLWRSEDSLVSSKQKNISETEWSNFKDKITNRCIWTTPFTDHVRGFDGSSWVMESFNPSENSCTLKKYHRIHRWSPNSRYTTGSINFMSLCGAFFEFDPLDVRQF